MFHQISENTLVILGCPFVQEQYKPGNFKVRLLAHLYESALSLKFVTVTLEYWWAAAQKEEFSHWPELQEGFHGMDPDEDRRITARATYNTVDILEEWTEIISLNNWCITLEELIFGNLGLLEPEPVVFHKYLCRVSYHKILFVGFITDTLIRVEVGALLVLYTLASARTLWQHDPPAVGLKNLRGSPV